MKTAKDHAAQLSTMANRENWKSVSATCDCPHKIESLEVFIERSWSDDCISLEEAKTQIGETISNHLTESKYCGEECVEMKMNCKTELDFDNWTPKNDC